MAKITLANKIPNLLNYKCEFPKTMFRFLLNFLLQHRNFFLPICDTKMYIDWAFVSIIIVAVFGLVDSLVKLGRKLIAEYPEPSTRIFHLKIFGKVYQINYRRVDVALLQDAMTIHGKVVLLWALQNDKYEALLQICTWGFLGNWAHLVLVVYEDYWVAKATDTFDGNQLAQKLCWIFLEFINWSCILCYVFNYYKNCTFQY